MGAAGGKEVSCRGRGLDRAREVEWVRSQGSEEQLTQRGRRLARRHLPRGYSVAVLIGLRWGAGAAACATKNNKEKGAGGTRVFF